MMKLRNIMKVFEAYGYAPVEAELPGGSIKCVSLMFGRPEGDSGIDLYLTAPDLKEHDGRFTLAAGAGGLRSSLEGEALPEEWDSCGGDADPGTGRFYDRDLYIARPAMDDKGGFCTSERWKVKDWRLVNNRIIFTVEDPADPGKDADISSPAFGDGKQTYVVTFVRYGFAQITASSFEEAQSIADGYTEEDIPWSDSYEQLSIEETGD